MQKPEDTEMTSQIEENVHSHPNGQTAEQQQQALAGDMNKNARDVAGVSTTTDNLRRGLVDRLTNISYPFKKQNSEEPVPRYQYDKKKKELEDRTAEVEDLRRQLQKKKTELKEKDASIKYIEADARDSIALINAERDKLRKKLQQVQHELVTNQRELNAHVDRVENDRRSDQQKWKAERNDLLNRILDLSGGGEYASDEKLKLMLETWRGAVSNCVPSIFKAPNIKDPQDAAILDRFTDKPEYPVLKNGDPQLFNYVAESWLFKAVLDRTWAYFCIGLDEAINEARRGPQNAPNASEASDVPAVDQTFKNFENIVSQMLAGNCQCSLEPSYGKMLTERIQKLPINGERLQSG
jgi:hypothetical protein